MKNGQFQSDYQASLKLSWTLGPVSLVPTLSPGMLQMVSTQGTLGMPRLGFSLPVLTKGGSSVEEMGVDFRGGKVRFQMAPLGVLNPREEFQERWPRTGRRDRKPERQRRYPLGRRKERSMVFETQNAFIGSADPTNV